MIVYTSLTLVIAVASIIASLEAKKSSDLTRHVFEDNDSADLSLYLRQGQNDFGEIRIRNNGKFPSPSLDVSFTLEKIQVSDDRVIETIKTDKFSARNLRPWDINLENDVRYTIPSNTFALKSQIDAGEVALRVRGALSYDNGFKRIPPVEFCWETQPSNTPFASWDTCDRAKMNIAEYVKAHTKH